LISKPITGIRGVRITSPIKDSKISITLLAKSIGVSYFSDWQKFDPENFQVTIAPTLPLPEAVK
jgi:hypothetical protein